MMRLALSVSVVLLLCGLCGCGSPFLHPAATQGVTDAGLVGEWLANDPSSIQAVITQGDGSQPSGTYDVALTVVDKGERKTDLRLDLTLTDVGTTRYADLFLARTERDELVAAYGFLVVPVHQVLRIARDGDSLTVWSFRGDWLEERSMAGAVTHDRVTMGGGDLVMVTAPTDQIRAMLSRIGNDERAFGDPIVFRRIKD